MKLHYYSVIAILVVSQCTVCCKVDNEKRAEGKTDSRKNGMVLIEGGEFVMGTDQQNGYSHEGPAHRVKVHRFWMDETEVTNAQFKKFVDATGYKTVAELKPEWEELRKQLPPGTRRPERELLPGAMVFTPPDHAVPLNDFSQWWQWKDGANWLHPEGPESKLDGKWNFPVIHVALKDAQAYASWAGKRLPTEAEWEYASRGGNFTGQYPWGNEVTVSGRYMANIFQGNFPDRDLAEDGFKGSAPVRTFPPNAYGLYDMIGNVWEWTSDLYDQNYYKEPRLKSVSINPKGSNICYDESDPYANKYVTKGGSFLCAENYCMNYRSTARQGTSFDSGSSNIGFRCVKDAE